MRVLNGFRGLAVLLVFTSHTPLRLIMGDFGQQAVYLFFFLSAFLLTLPLIKKSYSLLEFTRKRFFRIYPLYLIVVICLYILSRGKFSFIDLTSNLLFFQPFLHTPYISSVAWSLVIEVQFYILLPLMIKFIFDKDKIRILNVVIIFVSVYVYRVFQMSHYIENMQHGSMRIVDGYFLEVIDMFLLGSILAHMFVYPPKWKLKTNWVMTTFVLIVFAGLPLGLELIKINRSVVVLFALIPVYSILIAYLFYFTVISATFLNRMFGNKILDFYAQISYSFYLVHLPILQFFRGFGETSLQSVILGGAALVTATVVAFMGYKIIEQPFMKLGELGQNGLVRIAVTAKK